MTDSHLNNSKSLRDVRPDVFAQFLKFLSPDNEKAGHIYNRLRERLSGFFRLKGISDPDSAAHETLDRAALKISSGTPVPDVNRYCFGIARNIVREKLRFEQRETTSFHEFIKDLNNSSDEQVERIYLILKPCFEQLSVEDQKLLISYCQDIQGRARAEHRRMLAEAMMTTVLALRMRVTRLRNSLSDCVRKRSERG